MSLSLAIDALIAVGTLLLIAVSGILVKAYFTSKNPPKGKEE